ncbi:DUF6531 domain-containing protein [Delftia tsuruhatensis]
MAVAARAAAPAPPRPAAACGGAGPATQGNSSSTHQGAGNPIHLINGNKYQREVDMPALPGLLGLEVVRHYNSSYSRAYVPPGLLGRGWLLSYEARLYDHPTNLQIVQADGTRIIFSKLREHPSLCASEQPGNGIVRIEGPDTKGTKETKPGQERHYTWQWMDGRELRFNHRGRLTRISLPSGEQVRLDYNAKGNRLLKVTDPQGRSLRLHYAQASGEGSFTGVQAIDTPLGRIDYRHGSAPLPGSTQPQAKLNASLVQVSLPSADGQAPVQRHYHYEDPRHPTLLTGISVQGQGSDGKPMDERIASYAYGDTGRAILSVRGPPDSQQEKVTLDLSQPWKNTLTNSLGQTTTYHYDTIGGQWRLLEVRGPGCASCGPGDMRYRYDAQGRLTDATRLDPAGRPLEGTRTELDPFGRPLAVYRIAYTQGQARAPQLQVRYGYGKDPGSNTRPNSSPGPASCPGANTRSASATTAAASRCRSPRRASAHWMPRASPQAMRTAPRPSNAARATATPRSTAAACWWTSTGRCPPRWQAMTTEARRRTTSRGCAGTAAAATSRACCSPMAPPWRWSMTRPGASSRCTAGIPRPRRTKRAGAPNCATTPRPDWWPCAAWPPTPACCKSKAGATTRWATSRKPAPAAGPATGTRRAMPPMRPRPASTMTPWAACCGAPMSEAASHSTATTRKAACCSPVATVAAPMTAAASWPRCRPTSPARQSSRHPPQTRPALKLHRRHASSTTTSAAASPPSAPTAA